MAAKQLIVVPIFWGRAWATGSDAPVPPRPFNQWDVLGKINTIVQSYYLDGLLEYDVRSGGSVSPGHLFLDEDRDIPNPFTGQDCWAKVDQAINDGLVPAPTDWDLNQYRIVYSLFVAPGHFCTDPNIFGQNNKGYRSGAAATWSSANSDLDGVVETFAHELVEGGANAEIADDCRTQVISINGVKVSKYKRKDGSCWPSTNIQRAYHGVAATARRPDQLDLFAVGADGNVYTSWWTGGSDWSGLNGWRSIGGKFPGGQVEGIAATARTPDNLDVFVIGNDGRVYTSWWAWSSGQDWSGVNDDWRSIGGIFPQYALPSVVARTPDNLDVFIVGNDGKVYTSWWYAGADWSGINDDWRAIGGSFMTGARVTSVARKPDQLDLFAIGAGVVYTSWWTGGSDWSGLNGWRPIGGDFPDGGPVSAVARTPDNLDLFVVGNDGVVYTSWWYAGADWSGTNNNWRPIGGYFPVEAQVTAVARRPDQLDLFAVGNDGVVYTSWWSAGSDWSGINNNWRPIGGYFPPGSPVSAVARTPDNLDLFVIGNDGVVYTSWWQAGADWSGTNNNWRPIGTTG